MVPAMRDKLLNRSCLSSRLVEEVELSLHHAATVLFISHLRVCDCLSGHTFIDAWLLAAGCIGQGACV